MKVFITRKLPSNILSIIENAGFDIDIWDSDEPVDYNYMIEHSKNVVGLLCTLSDKIDENFLSNAKSLKVISTDSVGFDHIDMEAVESRKIRVGHTGGISTDSIAELAVALLLMLSRKLIQGISKVKLGEWTAWKPYWMCGQSLSNSTVGIIGVGNIGMAIAKRLKSFNVATFLGSDIARTPEELNIDDEKSVILTEFPELLQRSDFVFASCSLNDSTRDMFNEWAFSQMKKTAIFINISRGPVVDHEALYNVLLNKQIEAAGIDVCVPEPLPPDHKLLTLDNLVVLPHMASATFEARKLMGTMAANNLVEGLQGIDMMSEV